MHEAVKLILRLLIISDFFRESDTPLPVGLNDLIQLTEPVLDDDLGSLCGLGIGGRTRTRLGKASHGALSHGEFMVIARACCRVHQVINRLLLLILVCHCLLLLLFNSLLRLDAKAFVRALRRLNLDLELGCLSDRPP